LLDMEEVKIVPFHIGWHIQFTIGDLLVFLVEDNNFKIPYPGSAFAKSYQSPFSC